MKHTYFTEIPDFDAKSSSQICPISNLPKQRQNRHEPVGQNPVDDFILRGPALGGDDGHPLAYNGYLDIRPEVIFTTARELGMVDGDKYELVTQALQERSEHIVALKQELEGANERVRQLILVNAEQIVQQSALADELSAAYEDLYDPNDLQDLIEEGQDI